MPSADVHIDELLTRHGDRLYGLCVRLDPDPGDAYGAVCERLLHALPRFDPAKGSLRGWAVTVAHRVLVDRHRRRRPVEPLSGVEVSTERSAPVRVAQRQQQERLESALQELHEAQRRVVVLHHLDGRSLAEIAEVEDVAVGTVKSRLHRGRAHLAVLLKEER